MPGNIHDRYRKANIPEVDALRAELSEMRRDMQQMIRVITEQAARPNPAPHPPARGLSDEVLVQLLLAERDRADRASERLLEANDPMQQIQGLIALSDVLPQNNGDGDNEMLKGALMALGSVIVDKMDTGGEDEGDPSPHHPHAEDVAGQHLEPREPLFVAVDSDGVPGPSTDSGLEVG